MALNFDIFCGVLPYLDDTVLARCLVVNREASAIVSRHLYARRRLLICIRNLKNVQRIMRHLNVLSSTGTVRVVIALAADNPMSCWQTSCILGDLVAQLLSAGCEVEDMFETMYLDHLIHTFALEKKPGVNCDFFTAAFCFSIASRYQSGRMFHGFTEAVTRNWKQRLASHEVKRRKRPFCDKSTPHLCSMQRSCTCVSVHIPNV